MSKRYLPPAIRAVLPLVLLMLVACTTDETTTAGASATASDAEQALSPPAATEEQVTVQNDTFEPDELTISAGTTVTWVNEDEHGHTITHGEGGAPLQDAVFDEELSLGQAVSYTFVEPGTYPVTCRIHHDMQMTITVEEP